MVHYNPLPSNQHPNIVIAGLSPAIEKNIIGIGTPELKLVVVFSANKTEDKENISGKITSKSKLYIKNMVSIRCKMVVKAILEKLGLHYVMVELGIAEIMEDISNDMRNQLKTDLQSFGFELMEDNHAILIESIKNTIVEMIYNEDVFPKAKTSVYLSKKLNHSYGYLSNLFSEVMGTTIAHYIIVHKIERVKELLVYDELTLKEISFRLRYSSEAYLSSQFKNITGLTPSHFKQLKNKKRISLENI